MFATLAPATLVSLCWLASPVAARSVLQAALTPLQNASHGAAAELLWSLNCGGASFTVPGAITLRADQPYQVGSAGFEGGEAIGKPTGAVGGFENPYEPVTATAREGWTAYRFTVPNGRVLVRLHMAEISDKVSGPDLRRFGVRAEGQSLFDDLDLAAEYGFRYGGVVAGTVAVDDGVLDLEVLPGGDPALLGAVEVWSVPAEPHVPTTVGPVQGFGSYHRNVLTWPAALDPLVTGYRVWRASSAEEPYRVLADVGAGPPRFLDTSAPAGRTVSYRVAAFNVDGDLGPWSSPVAATALSTDRTTLRAYAIEIDAASLAALNADPGSDDEVGATFLFEGTAFPVQVRYRGGGSRFQPKKSWKVKFPPSALFEGRSDVNLKSQWIDPSMLREPVTNELFQFVGHPVARHRRVHLEVNGEFAGVFNEIEQLDEKYLAARNRDTSGPIHKTTANQEYATTFKVLPSTEAYATSYPLKINEGAGYGDLEALVQLVNDPATTIAELADVFDIDGYLSYAAVVGWTGDADQSNKNYYLYHDLELERWEWITWDNDRSFHDVAHPIDGATSTCETCGAVNRLKDKVLSFPRLRHRYGAKLEALMEEFANEEELPVLMSELHRELRADARVDIHDGDWESSVEFEASLAELQAYVADRNAFVQGVLPAYVGGVVVKDLWINEVLAVNHTGLVDEAGEFEPWVELYNANSVDLSLDGMFLTDDLGAPAKWPIPSGVIVPAGGHVLFWADGEPADGPLHTSFRLQPEGGELALSSAPFTSPFDFVSFGPQVSDVTLGRRRDANAFFAPLPTPTPAAPNTTAGNLPPFLSWIQHAPVQVEGVPVEITCQAKDSDGLVAVEVVYRVDAGPLRSLPMSPLGSDRWTASVPGQALGALVEYYLRATDSLSAVATSPHGASGEFLAWTVAQPTFVGLVINEVVADNGSILADETGAFEDYVELYNGTGAAVNLSGMHLTDDLQDPTAWSFPTGTVLAAGDVLIVWADGDLDDGPLHADFGLSKNGESVGLFNSVQGGLGSIDALDFGALGEDLALGRMPDGGPVFGLVEPSPGVLNLPVPGGVAIYDGASPNPVRLASASVPVLGASLGLDVSVASAGTAGVLLVGLQSTSQVLPTGGLLLVSEIPAFTSAFATDAAGAAQATFLLPDGPSWIGVPIYFQALTLADGATNGLVANLKAP